MVASENPDFSHVRENCCAAALSNPRTRPTTNNNNNNKELQNKFWFLGIVQLGNVPQRSALEALGKLVVVQNESIRQMWHLISEPSSERKSHCYLSGKKKQHNTSRTSIRGQLQPWCSAAWCSPWHPAGSPGPKHPLCSSTSSYCHPLRSQRELSFAPTPLRDISPLAANFQWWEGCAGLRCRWMDWVLAERDVAGGELMGKSFTSQ